MEMRREVLPFSLRTSNTTPATLSMGSSDSAVESTAVVLSFMRDFSTFMALIVEFNMAPITFARE